MPASSARAPRGLTLIETLVALALLAILSVMGFRALDAVVTSRQQLSEEAQRQRTDAAVWRWLERDLQSARLMGRTELTQSVVAIEGGLRFPAADWRLGPEGLVREDRLGRRLVLMADANGLEAWLWSPANPPTRLFPGRPWSAPDGELGLEIRLARQGRTGVLSQTFALGLGVSGRGL